MKFLRKITKNIKKNKKLYRKLILFVFFGAIAGIYFHNVTRDVYSGDIGDLVTAAWVFGVAHPPGYPLFTFLGYLFSHYLPFIDLPPVSKVAFISVISSVVGLIFFYKFAFRVSKSMYISLLSTSILAFSYLYWLQAEIPEVFGLNNMFVILILYYSILFYQEKKARHLYLLVFLCGLSLTHHHTILFIFPSVLLLVVRHFKFVFWNWKRVLIMLGIFVLGLLPYMYVPIAASQNPVINWNNATNIENFIHLIKRDSYSGFAPNLVSSVQDNQYMTTMRLFIVQNYINTIILNYSYQIIIVFLFGIVFLFIKDKILCLSLIFAFLFSGFFLVFYGAPIALQSVYIGIIERFYVISAVIFMFITVYGFLFIKVLINKLARLKMLMFIILSYFVIVPYFLLIYNFSKTDLSKTNIGNNMVIDMYSSIPKNSVLIVSGDTQSFNTWYMKYALNFRKDTEIINSTGTGSNTFLESEQNKLRLKNPKIKQGDLYKNTLIAISNKRNVFSVKNANNQLLSKIYIPKGLVNELIDYDEIPSKDEYEMEIKRIIKSYHIPSRKALESYDDNLITTEIPTIYSEAFIQIGNFFSYIYKDLDKAEYYYKKAIWIDDEYHHAYALYGTNQFNKSQNCAGSIKNLSKAIELYPIRNDYYLHLHFLYNKCNVSKERTKALIKEYKIKFNKNIEKEYILE